MRKVSNDALPADPRLNGIGLSSSFCSVNNIGTYQASNPLLLKFTAFTDCIEIIVHFQLISSTKNLAPPSQGWCQFGEEEEDDRRNDDWNIITITPM